MIYHHDVSSRPTTTVLDDTVLTAAQQPIPHGTTTDNEAFRRPGKYASRVADRHPPIYPSQILLFSKNRPGRLINRKASDPDANVTFGDSIIYKAPGTSRFMFQNVKGLSYNQSGDDYNYFLSSMLSFSIDVFGMAETNSGWQHQYVQDKFKQCIRRQLQLGKAVFGSPSRTVDPLDDKDTFQAGGTTQVVRGNMTTTVFGPPILDPTGLGRWCGFTIIGKADNKLSVITGYRTCRGSIATSPLGSSFHREYVYFKDHRVKQPQPRKQFFLDLASTISELQNNGHALLIMLDANSDLESDSQMQDFLHSHDLSDVHKATPAPSTYIGASERRIDYIFGCSRTVAAITRQGTLSYFEGPQSDHRPLFVDLNLRHLLGVDTMDSMLPKHEQRWLRSGNPELVAIYLDKMREYYKQHKMTERIDTLFKTHHALTRQQVRRLLTAWDEDQGRAMKVSEAALVTRPKQYKWSPRLRNAGVILRYWKLRLRELTHSMDYSKTFERWERQIQSQDSSFQLPDRNRRLEIHEVRLQLSSANKMLRQIQKNATQSRTNSYEELLAKYAADNNPNTKQESQRRARIVSRTIRGEEGKQLFGKLRQVMTPSEYSSLSQIQVPRRVDNTAITEPGQVHQILQADPEQLVWDTIVTKEDIEAHILSFNREAFRAAAESPCGSGVIHDALTFTSLSEAAERCLHGEIPEDWYGDRQLLREFLASFQIPNSVLEHRPIKLDISNGDILKGFKSWRETTTTSPSGRHLGHYKALITDPELLDCLRKFLTITVSRGIAPPRWCKAVNVMIEKDPGRPRINRLRIIHLFEADYNLFLKIMWGSRLVRRSVDLNLLNDGQHGSVPGRTTMDPVMLNQLTTDLCRVLKVNYARFDNDASACFDRIIVALGMMAARRCGMPVAAIRTHAKALELMQYMVKTVYGVSDRSYQGTALAPLFGTGQGSGASPAVWLSLVVILLNTLERVVPERICFTSADGTIHHKRLVDAFVDDTAIGLTDAGERSLLELVNALESVAQTWEQLLHFSGGALNLSKCSWYVMFWDWRQGRPVLREIKADDPTIKLYQGSSSSFPVPIRQQRLNESSRILGVHQTPLGDFSDHIKILKSKADRYASCLRSPRLNSSDVRVFHRSIYKPAMLYSLPAIAIDEEELNSIQSKILPTLVQRLGLSSKLPTAIRHGPVEMGGLNLMDLRTECGIEMIKYFRHEVYGNTKVGQLLLLQLQASQLESGLSYPLLEEPSYHIAYLTPTWILSMRQFMSNHNIRITLTDTFTITLQGRHDSCIMDLQRLRGYSTRQQIDLNLVRLHLQVSTIAELVDPTESNKIATWALEARRPNHFCNNKAWPRQDVLTPSQRRLWKRYIQSQYLRYDRFWATSPRPTLRDLKQSITSTGSMTTAPDDIDTVISSLPRPRRRLLSHISLKSSSDKLWEECQKKQKLTIATDGGLKGHLGTFGWIISTKANEVLVEGAGPVDGPYDTANSTRCELGGYAASLFFLSLLHSLWGKQHKCTFRWVTDSKAAITNVTKATERKRPKQRQPSNADYLGIIKTATVAMRRSIYPVWVKGHQTNSGGQSNDSKMNNRADHLATWYRMQRSLRQSVERTDHTPESRVSIVVNGIRVVGQEEATLRFHINGYHLRNYIQTRRGWSNQTWDRVDFELFGRFYRKLTPTAKVAHTKFIFDQWHTGTRRQRVSAIKSDNLDNCPCCLVHIETTAHVLRCQHNPDRVQALSEFRKNMSPRECHPVYTLVKGGVMSWYDDKVYVPDITEFPAKMRDRIRCALKDQETIGWDNAVKGYMSVEWRNLAEEDMYDHATQEQQGDGFPKLTSILRHIHHVNQRLWKSRNTVLHQSDEQALKDLRDSEAREIREMYAHPDLLQTGDRHYCDAPLDDILKKSTASRRRWLRYTRMSRERMIKDGKRQLLMTQFFRPTAPVLLQAPDITR